MTDPDPQSESHPRSILIGAGVILGLWLGLALVTAIVGWIFF